LNVDGDSLYLLDTTGAVIDMIAFGRQIQGYSIGRGGNGEWTLCEPTFGAANHPETLGDQSRLRINEWLTDREFSSTDNFVELYNPNVEPASLSGLSLSIAAGTPDQSPFPPLSY